jgi:hypothetical protein
VRIRNAVFYSANKNYVWSDKQKIFEELPSNIKSEIALEMYFGVIKRIRFFDDKDAWVVGTYGLEFLNAIFEIEKNEEELK